ncbi:putative bifunctional diguanylate cyclase/phosphodiesterase [Sphingomonas sp. GlSt437]
MVPEDLKPPVAAEMPVGGGEPLFLLSFRQRDELAALAAGAGWQVVAARRAEASAQRFAASGARVAVVDARGALGDGLAATAVLGEGAAARGAALLVLVSRPDTPRIGAFFDAGATHFLASPHTEAELIEALRFAARHAERTVPDRRRVLPAMALGWRLVGKQLRLTPALATLLEVDDDPPPRAALARLSRDQRRAVLGAIGKARHQGSTAIALDTEALGRLALHVQYDAAADRIDGLIERLIDVPTARTLVADAMTLRRDSTSARDWLSERLAAGEGELHAIIVSLSRFDIVNTTYGRAMGDALLRAALQRINEAAAAILDPDFVAVRTTGADFVVATAAPAAKAELAGSRIAEALARPFIAGGQMVVMGCRIGLATARAGDDADALLARAGEALAEARASDSATMVVRRGGAPDAASLDTLAVDLRHAIAQDEINLLFQPQVAIATGAIVGVEALVRWEHSAFGALGAETLFAAAERAELAIALSDHIQRGALAAAARWPAPLRELRLAINLTAADVARPGFADIFLDRVDASGFPRGRLTVEITESGLIGDLGAAARLLGVLRAAGLRVAIDDFGTGYSSLAYLKALPLDYLKIDKKLAQDIAGSPRDRVVVRGVIDMARALGLTVIAEGVETETQLDLLAKEGCQYYQGFLCSPAVDADELVRLIAR